MNEQQLKQLERYYSGVLGAAVIRDGMKRLDAHMRDNPAHSMTITFSDEGYVVEMISTDPNAPYHAAGVAPYLPNALTMLRDQITNDFGTVVT